MSRGHFCCWASSAWQQSRKAGSSLQSTRVINSDGRANGKAQELLSLLFFFRRDAHLKRERKSFCSFSRESVAGMDPAAGSRIAVFTTDVVFLIAFSSFFLVRQREQKGRGISDLRTREPFFPIIFSLRYGTLITAMIYTIHYIKESGIIIYRRSRMKHVCRRACGRCPIETRAEHPSAHKVSSLLT